MAALPVAANADSPPGPPVIFFDWNSVHIFPEAAAILDTVPLIFNRIRAKRVVIGANADRSGSEAYNIILTRRRAEAVADYLVARGLPRRSLSVEAWSESRPLEETADGVREPQNRYVLIQFEG